MRLGKKFGSRFTRLLLFPRATLTCTCIRNPRNSQDIQVFLQLLNADENDSSLKATQHLCWKTGPAYRHPATHKNARLGLLFHIKMAPCVIPSALFHITHSGMSFMAMGCITSSQSYTRTARQIGYLAVTVTEDILLLLYWMTRINL